MEKYLIADFSGKNINDPLLVELFSNPENKEYAREPVLALMPDKKHWFVFF